MVERVTLGAYRPSQKWKIVSEIGNALSTRLSYSKYSAEFEEKVAHIHGCRHGVISNSGTSALLVALQALKEAYLVPSHCTRILIPATTFVATVNAVIQAGFEPELVDIDPETWQMDVDAIADYMPFSTIFAFLPVHMFGNTPDMDTLLHFARANAILVLEDCCEAFGASYKGKQVGSIGHIGCFSTYVAHHIVTGVGGMCTTNSPELDVLMRSLVNHGINVDSLPSGTLYDPAHLGRKFVFDRIGYSFRVTEIEAILGLDQVSNWSWRIEKRIANANILRMLIKDHVQMMKVTPGAYCSYMMFPVMAREMTNTDAIATLNEHNIEARMAMPLTNQPCYNFREDDYPNAKRLNQHGFYVGCHEYLEEDQLEHVAKVINEDIR